MPFSQGIAKRIHPGFSRRNVKPIGRVEVDWLNKLSRSLSYLDFLEYGSTPILCGEPANQEGTISREATSKGRGIDTSPSGRIRIAPHSGIDQSASFAFACSFYFKGGTPSNFARPFERTANGGSNPYYNWGFELAIGGNKDKLRCGLRLVSTRVSIDISVSGGFTAGHYTLIGNVKNGILYFHLNDQIGSTSAASPTLYTSGVNDLMYGSNGSSYDDTKCTMLWGAVWQRSLNNSDIHHIKHDFYQIVKPSNNLFFTQTVFSILVAPPSISAASGTLIGPTVHGSISKTPAALSAAAVTVSPTISQGSLLLGMQSLSAATGVIVPSVIHGLIGITPAALSAAAATIAPTIIFGSALITPAALAAAASTASPVVKVGSITASPSPAIARALAVEATILGGNVIIQMPFIDAAASTIAPSVIQDSMIVSPAALAAAAATVNPNIVLGGVILQPTALSAAAATIAPDILLSSITAVITPAIASAITQLGGVLQSSMLFPVSSAVAGTDTLLSGVKIGPIIVNPPIATAKTDIVQPSVVIFVLIQPMITSITEVIYATFITEISHETYLEEVKPTDIVIKTSNETIIYRIA